jgi:bifunctional UDP-N-acetylglucosamine pyrophosphorylase / glucosamine-1-phosphate N-acetyltransferase
VHLAMTNATTTPTRRALACIVMAGGKGTRMRSRTPKVLHPVCGRPILGWVLEAAREADADRLVVVTPPEAQDVRGTLGEDVDAVVQRQARGTGDAVSCGMTALVGFDGDVLIVSGDMPLMRGALLRDLVAAHRDGGADATLLSVNLDADNAFGRVIRDRAGAVTGIVEQRDASAAQLAVSERNAGFYLFDAAALRDALAALVPDNAQGELYLTDTIALLAGRGRRVAAHVTNDQVATVGINTRVDLAAAEAVMRQRILERHMLAGVTIVDPQTTHVEHGVKLAADSRVEPFTVLRGQTRVAAGATVGPSVVAVDAVIGEDCTVGPFCYLRPGTVLEAKARAGTFVEIKNSQIGAGTKVPHLSYIGDADIGDGSNIAAGNITANYHAGRKSRTTIGASVHTGCDTVFVPPVSVGDNAVIAAGSIITEDVPADALAIARARQVNIEGYARREQDG